MKLINIILENWIPDTSTINGVTTDRKVAGSTDNIQDFFKHIDNLPDTVESIEIPLNTKSYKTSADQKKITASPGYKQEIKDTVSKVVEEYKEKGEKVHTYSLITYGFKEDNLYVDLRTEQSDDFDKAMSRGDYGSLD